MQESILKILKYFLSMLFSFAMMYFSSLSLLGERFIYNIYIIENIDYDLSRIFFIVFHFIGFVGLLLFLYSCFGFIKEFINIETNKK